MRGSVDELSFTCPHCGARVGEFCVRNGVKRKDWPHSARVAKIPPKPRKNDVGSVRAIPTYFESNRRRH